MSKIKDFAQNFISKNLETARGKITLALAVFIVFYVIYSFYAWANTESTDNAYTDGQITFISPEVNGKIELINFVENKQVAKGDLLVKIDSKTYKALVDQAKSKMETAVLAIRISEDEYSLSKLNLEQAKLDLELAAKELSRVSKLALDSFSSKKILEQVQIANNKAKLGIQAAEEKVSLAEFATTTKKLAATSAKSSLVIAQENLDNTEIRAPIDGVITSSSARVGSFITAGRPIFAIVPIDKIHVKANFKETQITKFKEGMKADIKFDSIKGEHFAGKIASIYPATGSKFSLIPTDNATGNFTKIVQRVPVIIELEIPEKYKNKVGVGFSAHVSVRTDQQNEY